VWLDGVEFVPYSTQLTDMMKVQRGNLDACWLSEADWVRVRNDPKWKHHMTEQLTVAQNYLVINAQMKPFDEVLVRQALNWAIDRERLAKIHGNLASYQILPKGMPGYVDGAQFYDHDPARARELLAEAGYPDGFTTTISLPAENDFHSQTAQAVQQDLREVGIDAKIEMRPAMAYWGELATPRTIALGVSTWLMDFPDPYDWIKPLFSRAAAVKDGTNFSFWWNRGVEEMLTDAQATLDPNERVAKFSEIQEVISENAPIVPLDQPLMATLNSRKVGGFYIHQLYQFDPEHYWRQ
jgi:ABC-type transport system substrate-binding protein